MNTFDLVRAGTDKAIAAACGKCGSVHSPLIYAAAPDRAMNAARSAAEECCAPRKCEDCEAEVERAWLACKPCRARRDTQREAERFAAAEKLSLDEYEGDVLYDPANDQWFYAEEGFGEDDRFEDGYAYACTYRPLRLDAQEILYQEIENGEHHDEMYISPQLGDELQTFLDDWCARSGQGSYFPEYSRAVLLPAPAFDEEEADEVPA